MIYSLEYQLFRINPAGYHFTNLLLHIINIILLFYFISLISNNKTIINLTTALFALHPVQTEPVNWIGARADLLVGLFSLLAITLFINFIKTTKYRFYIFSLFAFILALFSKEIAILIPLIFLSLTKLLDKKIKSRLKIAPFIIAMLYFILRQIVMKELPQRPWWGGSFYSNILSVMMISSEYIFKLIYPYNLSIDYNFILPESIFDIRILASVAIYTLLIIWAFKNYPKNKLITFGIVWFIFFLLPALNIVPLTVLVADRFLYLSSIGVFLAISISIARFTKTKTRKNLIIVLFSLLIINYAFTITRRTKDWHNDKTLFESVLKYYPQSARAYAEIGSFYTQQENPDKAEYYFKTAQTLSPNNIILLRGLGSIYLKQNKLDSAEKEFKKALELSPQDNEAGNLLAITYKLQGKIEDAIILYEKYLTTNPNNFYIYHNLSYLYIELERNEEAKTVLLKAVENNTISPPILYGLGIIKYLERDLEKSLEYFIQSTKLDPNFAHGYYGIAVICNTIGKTTEADFYLKKIRDVEPELANNFTLKFEEPHISKCPQEF
ncbi:MAG: tetratricopeptide repeat protein [Candidatus Saelkia tenebricola]|nr:tetratricopeptide repeat protein [Candidatus Saelkia tenebricola]